MKSRTSELASRLLSQGLVRSMWADAGNMARQCDLLMQELEAAEDTGLGEHLDGKHAMCPFVAAGLAQRGYRVRLHPIGWAALIEGARHERMSTRALAAQNLRELEAHDLGLEETAGRGASLTLALLSSGNASFVLAALEGKLEPDREILAREAMTHLAGNLEHKKACLSILGVAWNS